MNRKLVALACGLVMGTGLGCGGGGGGKKGGTSQPTWTVFVYGHGDHNLSASLLRDVAEMTQASLTGKVNVIVAVDLSAGRTDAEGAPYPTGLHWLRIPGGNAAPVEIGSDPEMNLDDPEVLAGAVSAAFEAYPADRYGVVLWDHGGSWTGGFGGDENDHPGDPAFYGGGMSAHDVATALRAALDDRGLSGTRPLEFLSFDTCLMAGNEVAYEMRGLAKVYLANAELDFGDGWNYQTTLSWLDTHRDTTPRAFAEAEVLHWDVHHRNAGSDDRLLRSHAALDLAAYDAYVTAFGGLTSALLASGSIDPFEVGRAQYAATPGFGSDFSNPDAFPALRDAGQILDGLAAVKSDAAVAAKAAAARTALRALTIRTSSGTLREANTQGGVHMESPLATGWADRRGGYLGLGWNQATGWSDLLDGMASFADATAPTVLTTLENGNGPTTQAPPLLTLSSPDSDLAEARVFLAETVGGSTVMYGVIGFGAVQPGTSYHFEWDGTQVVLSDVASQSAVTVLPWIGGASPIFVAPGQLTADGETIEAYAVLDPGMGEVDTLLIQVDGRIASLGMSSLRGLTFTPAVWDLGTGAFVPATPLTIPDVAGAKLPLDLVKATPGSYHLVTTMTDLWGNTGSSTEDVTVVNPF